MSSDTGGMPYRNEGNQPLLLHGPDKAWEIKAGSVDLFLVRCRKGRPEGRRHPLGTVRQGEAAFALPLLPEAEAVAVLGVPSLDCRWRETTSETLLRDGGFSRVQAWLRTFASSPYLPSPPEEKRSGLESDKAIALPEGAIIASTPRPLWVRIAQGSVCLYADPKLSCRPEDGPLLVFDHMWIAAGAKTEMTVLSAETLSHEDVCKTLDLWHRAVTRRLDIGLAEAEKADGARLNARLKADQACARSSLARLAAIINPEIDACSARVEDDPYAQACRLVADAQKIPLRLPPDWSGPDTRRDPLRDIARASRIRCRRIRLHDDWWRDDLGPILGIRKEDGLPVAILPLRPGRFEIHDPVENTVFAANARTAERIAPTAYQLYRSFPDRPIQALDLMRFALHGARQDLWLVLLSGFCVGLLAMILPIGTGILVDTVIPAAQLHMLGSLTMALLAAALASAIFGLVRSIAMLRVQGWSTMRVQSGVMDRLLALPAPFFRDFTAGDLADRAMGVDSIQQQLSGAAVSGLLGGITASFSFLLLFWYSVSMAMVAGVLVAIVLLVSGSLAYVQVRYRRLLAGREGELRGLLYQLLGGIAKIRAAGAEPRAFERWATLFSDKRSLEFGVRLYEKGIRTFHAVFPTLTSMLLYGAFLYFLQKGAEEGTPFSLSTGSFLAFFAAFGQLLSAMLLTISTAVGMLDILPTWERALPITQALPEIASARPHPGTIQGDLEVSHVTFRYAPEMPPVLRDVSIAARPGEFVAIVGSSGAGKSSLLRVLLGFEIPESGSVYYDGKDLATVDVLALRSQIGVALQNGVIVAGSIFHNIVGGAAYTLDEAWEAARLAGLADDIRAMPMNMHTVLANGGGGLSGGQRQRLLIARALARKPRLVYFDESTSALDNRTQEEVTRNLEMLDMTRVVIAHRLSTIIQADRIYVMEKGAVVEEGDYDSLMSQDGHFAALVRRQIL